jgi:predicted pyridoxine 5'-phosphate oxidase superfamily flavin-nucleotide-binding protein
LTSGSPWHPGERRLQALMGVADRMAAFGPKVIRDHLPDQHRAFYRSLPFLVVGAVDATGAPWATVLEGLPGFMSAPDPRSLRIDALPSPADPADLALAAGNGVGLLGIELETRRRNRLNGNVTVRNGTGVTVDVVQAFGNCPQYIQTRAHRFARSPAGSGELPPQRGRQLDDAAHALIVAADTFFVASYVEDDAGKARHSVDVSHRGGKPGFVRIDGNVLTIPDFAGNLHFNTLGNLASNPRAGLLFMDFTTGDLLQLTGATALVLDGEEARDFHGAQRLWRFHAEEFVRRPAALALRWTFGEYSPRLELTGTWDRPAGLPR